MTVPFRVDPEPVKRPAQQDPFLEFDSERDRPSRSLLGQQEAAKAQAELSKPLRIPELESLPAGRREGSAISPSFAFAIGVAGLVTAAVGYYQMGQLLSDRSRAGVVVASPAPPPPPVAPVAKGLGRLEISSDPGAATVSLNGKVVGVTPLSLPDMPPGKQEIVLTHGKDTVTRTVELTAGGTAVVAVVLGAASSPAAPAAAEPAAVPDGATADVGWVQFDSPIELRVLERGRPRGSTRGRLSLSAGTHDLELVSDIYEVRQTVTARVTAGRGTRVSVPLASGSLSINALPWADVWIDGAPVGTTPLANLTLKVGTYEVVFRHPTLGERQQKVVVKASSPQRLGVTMNR